MSIYCVFSSWEVWRNHTKHLCQFREDKDGNRSFLFPANRAVIKLAEDSKRYEVRNIHGERLFAGINGYEEAVDRIHYAQGMDVEITVNVSGKQRTASEYKRHIAPTIFKIQYTRARGEGAIGLAMEAFRNDEILGVWTFADVFEDVLTKDIIDTIDDFMGDDENYVLTFSWKQLEGLREIGRKDVEIDRQDFEQLKILSRKARTSLETELSAV